MWRRHIYVSLFGCGPTHSLIVFTSVTPTVSMVYFWFFDKVGIESTIVGAGCPGLEAVLSDDTPAAVIP